jgi:hypothetical protein
MNSNHARHFLMILLPASIMSGSQMTMEQMSLYCTVRRATTGKKHLSQGETANNEIMTYKRLNDRKWHENENGQSHDIFSSCATYKAQLTIGFATTPNRSLVELSKHRRKTFCSNSVRHHLLQQTMQSLICASLNSTGG